ncbi:MAG: DUF1318 domain-containing protein [Candidatus Auribacterota bacterium]|jgi:uncharacterized protein YdbL (DUF1318 family)|nr:DUF1318 domain-containing protein [Candidatus Auribacterota bacterium]
MNTRSFFVSCVALTLLYAGCTQHTIKVEQEKPLRVDVNMRIDVYQHVLEQANTIEDMVNQPGGHSFFRGVIRRLAVLDFASSAYAQSSAQFSDEVMKAIEGRRQRRDQIVEWGSKGVIGENNSGFVELYAPSGLPGSQLAELRQMIDQENRDRLVIYTDLSRGEGTTPEEVGKVYSIKLHKNAPEGMPIQTATGEWIIR